MNSKRSDLIAENGTRFKNFQAAIDNLATSIGRLLFWLVMLDLPLALISVLNNILASVSVRWLQILILLGWAILVTAAIWLIFTEQKRNELFTWLRKRIGGFAPFVYSFNLLWIAIYFFASVTSLLVKHNNLPWFTQGSNEITTGKLSDFYLWHFFDAVPFFKINSTLLWEEPLTYQSGWAGFILLVFKILVIFPVIAAFVSYFQLMGKADKE